MSEELKSPTGRTFYKWNEGPGQELMVTVLEMPVFDRANSFGGKDSFFVGESAAGEKIQVPLPIDAKSKVQSVVDRIRPGKTVLAMRWTGSKAIKGKAPMKLFSIQADGLA